jgi:hypothetical protein
LQSGGETASSNASDNQILISFSGRIGGFIKSLRVIITKLNDLRQGNLVSFTYSHWPPRCPDCEEQLRLAPTSDPDGHTTLKGYFCYPCDKDFTWRTLNEYRTNLQAQKP